jgi:hypothetical protein
MRGILNVPTLSVVIVGSALGMTALAADEITRPDAQSWDVSVRTKNGLTVKGKFGTMVDHLKSGGYDCTMGRQVMPEFAVSCTSNTKTKLSQNDRWHFRFSRINEKEIELTNAYAELTGKEMAGSNIEELADTLFRPERGEPSIDAGRDASHSRVGLAEAPFRGDESKIALVVRGSGPDSPALGCFIRNYDKSHLARHPNQLVTNVKLAIRNSNGESGYRYEFALQVRKRGKKDSLKTAGFCREEGASRLRCSVECDGGGIGVSVRRDSALMYLNRIRMASCGKDINDIDASEDLSGGIDDREFRIDRVDISMCSNMN